MAAIQNKHSVPGAQGRRRAQASTKPAVKNKKRARRAPRPPIPIVTQRGKTTIRRFPGRHLHRFQEAQGKPLDYIEFFTTGEYHAIDVRFQDKTAMHFVIEPGFTLETDYSDWKSGNGRRIKRWPLIRSQPLNA